MPIKMLAVELYKSQQKVHALRDKLEVATGLEADRLRRELAVAEKECEQLRRRIDARKDLYR
ncbi:hypothetical protein [Desulfogranum marinum]|jgi:hypothetical protein|uniref:hypothetical protein n=1 Tax=Desulfogranum marinum TaxID=453220 RepID=UPI00196369E4|nr:hypothetical protein [Desulfogranum marinum]MBM9512872.1 hypothetical protein [Desulfogranum marinum]